MKDFIREILSYGGLYKRIKGVDKSIEAEKISYGHHKSQYILVYLPEELRTDKLIIWVHGGGWNSGSPEAFDFVGQAVGRQGYPFVSIGYRLSPKHKYPRQIEDVCKGFNKAIELLQAKGISSNKTIVSGPSAGAHLTALLCYSKEIQEREKVDVSGVLGYIGVGGIYQFAGDYSLAIKLLLNKLFAKGYDKRQGEPYNLLGPSHIPMLLIHSEHDGLIGFQNALSFSDKARQNGIECELYSVVDKKNTHSWYTAGMFLQTRQENQALDKFYTWIDDL